MWTWTVVAAVQPVQPVQPVQLVQSAALGVTSSHPMTAAALPQLTDNKPRTTSHFDRIVFCFFFIYFGHTVFSTIGSSSCSWTVSTAQIIAGFTAVLHTFFFFYTAPILTLLDFCSLHPLSTPPCLLPFVHLFGQMSVHLDVWPRVWNLTRPHYLYPKLLTHVCTYSALILVTPFSLFCFELNNYNYCLTYINVFNVATAVSQHLWHKTFLFFVVVFLFTACDVDDMVINERLKRTKSPPKKVCFDFW